MQNIIDFDWYNEIMHAIFTVSLKAYPDVAVCFCMRGILTLKTHYCGVVNVALL